MRYSPAVGLAENRLQCTQTGGSNTSLAGSESSAGLTVPLSGFLFSSVGEGASCRCSRQPKVGARMRSMEKVMADRRRSSAGPPSAHLPCMRESQPAQRCDVRSIGSPSPLPVMPLVSRARNVFGGRSPVCYNGIGRPPPVGITSRDELRVERPHVFPSPTLHLPSRRIPIKGKKNSLGTQWNRLKILAGPCQRFLSLPCTEDGFFNRLER